MKDAISAMLNTATVEELTTLRNVVDRVIDGKRTIKVGQPFGIHDGDVLMVCQVGTSEYKIMTILSTVDSGNRYSDTTLTVTDEDALCGEEQVRAVDVANIMNCDVDKIEEMTATYEYEK